MSHGCKSAVVLVKLSRLSAASRSPGCSLPFSTSLASDFSMPARPFSSTGAATSRTSVSYPAAAATWAMPLPINPQPNTPTRLISATAASLDLEGFAQLFGDADERAGTRSAAGQGVLGADLAALHPVEHLFHRHLDLLVLRAEGAQHRQRGPGAGEERQRRVRRQHPDRQKDRRRRDPHPRQGGAG